MKRNYHKWTEDEEKVLIGLYAEGRPYAEIARQLKVSYGAVSVRIHNLKKLGKIQNNKNFT